jgi:hypothetical protein
MYTIIYNNQVIKRTFFKRKRYIIKVINFNKQKELWIFVPKNWINFAKTKDIIVERKTYDK